VEDEAQNEHGTYTGASNVPNWQGWTWLYARNSF